MSGILTLIPTPIDEESSLESTAFNLLDNAVKNELDQSVIVIEDLKPGRRRWLSYKLPRSIVEDFTLLNEHNFKEQSFILLKELKSGKNVYLMSDGGLPAFCDPGQLLVDLCHENKIKVTATPFCNSVILAVALSGFSHDQFVFLGFPPLDKEKRKDYFRNAMSEKKSVVLMDTPYRLKRILEEFSDLMNKKNQRKVFLAIDLGSSNEELLRDTPVNLLKRLKKFKREFVMVLQNT